MLWFFNKCQPAPFDDDNMATGCKELDENTLEHEQCKESILNYRNTLTMKWW